MQRKRLYVNSSLDRSKNSSSSNFRVYLDESIDARMNKIMIAVKKVSLPNTVYTFAFEDSILWYLTDVGGASEALKYIAIPTDKNYKDVSELIEDINTSFINEGDNISVSQDDTTKRLRFRNDSPFKIRIVSSNEYENIVNGTTIVNSCNNKIGLVGNLTDDTLDTGESYLATGIPKLLSTSMFYITSTTLGNWMNTMLPRSKTYKEYIIHSMLNTGGFGDVLQDSLDENSMFWIEIDGSLTDFDIVIKDENYREVNLNGANVIIELEYYLIGK